MSCPHTDLYSISSNHETIIRCWRRRRHWKDYMSQCLQLIKLSCHPFSSIGILKTSRPYWLTANWRERRLVLLPELYDIGNPLLSQKENLGDFRPHIRSSYGDELYLMTCFWNDGRAWSFHLSGYTGSIAVARASKAPLLVMCRDHAGISRSSVGCYRAQIAKSRAMADDRIAG